MEMLPMEITAPVGSSVVFTCQYEYSDPLDFVIFQDGVIVKRPVDIYFRYGGKVSKTWNVIVGYKPIVINCAVRNKQLVTIGQLIGRIYPGLTIING